MVACLCRIRVHQAYKAQAGRFLSTVVMVGLQKDGKHDKIEVIGFPFIPNKLLKNTNSLLKNQQLACVFGLNGTLLSTFSSRALRRKVVIITQVSTFTNTKLTQCTNNHFLYAVNEM